MRKRPPKGGPLFVQLSPKSKVSKVASQNLTFLPRPDDSQESLFSFTCVKFACHFVALFPRQHIHWRREGQAKGRARRGVRVARVRK